jgi:hypothetical protein
MTIMELSFPIKLKIIQQCHLLFSSYSTCPNNVSMSHGLVILCYCFNYFSSKILNIIVSHPPSPHQVGLNFDPLT